MESSKATRSGVNTMPTRFDTEALHRAAGTLPRPMEVKAMEDCTVDGRTQTNIRPNPSSVGSQCLRTPVSTRPIKGNSTKVLASTRDWSRQWAIPSTTARVESRAP